MGVLPLQFPDGVSADSLGLTGEEIFAVSGITELNSGITPRTVRVTATRPDGTVTGFDVIVRIDTPGSGPTTSTAASCPTYCATWRGPERPSPDLREAPPGPSRGGTTPRFQQLKALS